jgi:hypothetical protein
MIRTTALVRFAALACVGVALAACSGGGGSPGPTTPPTTATSSPAPTLVDSITPDLATAMASAARALTAVTSYDYRHLDTDHANAVRYLAEPFRSKYETSWQDVQSKAPSTHAVVAGKITNVAVSSVNGGKIVVLAFVQQTVTSKTAPDPRVEAFALQATMTRGAASWATSQLDILSPQSPAAPASTSWAAPDLAAALIAGRQCVATVAGPSDRAHVDTTLQAALACTSGNLHADIRANENQIRKVSDTTRAGSSVVTGIGISSVAADRVGLLAGVTISTTPMSGSPRKTQFRMMVTLERISGHWLMTKMENVVAS